MVGSNKPSTEADVGIIAGAVAVVIVVGAGKAVGTGARLGAELGTSEEPARARMGQLPRFDRPARRIFRPPPVDPWTLNQRLKVERCR